MILVYLILRKFDIDSLYICPLYLYTVATLPWKIQKVIFNSIIHTYFRLFTKKIYKFFFTNFLRIRHSKNH